MGGLSRRNTTIKKLQGEGTVFVVDAGDLFWKSERISSGELAQQKVKAELQAASYALVGVDAMLPAEGEFALGMDFVKAQASAHDLPYVASDLVCGGDHPFPRVRTVERGGITLAAVGLVGSGVELPGCERMDGEKAVREALDGLHPDVVVLLSGEDAATTARLVKALGVIDFTVTTDRKQLDVAEVMDGGALRLGNGARGKKLGALSFTLNPGAKGWKDDGAMANLATQRDRYAKRVEEFKQKLAAFDQPGASPGDKVDATLARDRVTKQIEFYQKQADEATAKLQAATDGVANANTARNTLVDLDANVADDPDTQALVTKAKDAINAAAPETPVVSGRELAYVGSAACAGCHAAETAQWNTTAHSHAWASLVGANRQLDSACYECHVTGAQHGGGPQSALEAQRAQLVNVGCESCHGPARDHLANPGAGGMRRDPGVDVCQSCHDGKQDGGRFDYPSYRQKVVHGLSTGRAGGTTAPAQAP